MTERETNGLRSRRKCELRFSMLKIATPSRTAYNSASSSNKSTPFCTPKTYFPSSNGLSQFNFTTPRICDVFKRPDLAQNIFGNMKNGDGVSRPLQHQPGANVAKKTKNASLNHQRGIEIVNNYLKLADENAGERKTSPHKHATADHTSQKSTSCTILKQALSRAHPSKHIVVGRTKSQEQLANGLIKIQKQRLENTPPSPTSHTLNFEIPLSKINKISNIHKAQYLQRKVIILTMFNKAYKLKSSKANNKAVLPY